MFDVMKSRWFYLSDKFLVGQHPDTKKLVLLVRSGNGDVPPMEVSKVLHLNGMLIVGEMIEEDGCKYYPLKEKEDDKAIRG